MERSSIRVGSILGFPVYLHYSFLLILPFLAWSFGSRIKEMAGYADVSAEQLELSPYVWGLVIALALFASVLFHELGHSVVARRMRIQIRGITLMLFGGIAHLEEMPTEPGEEAKIALAGPIVSFATGAACYALAVLLDGVGNPNVHFALSYLGYINIFLGLFNLLPAFPMDGGRVLRSLLARNRSFTSATKTAANVGKFFAFAFGILGLLGGNLFLVLIAFFVYMGASQELHYTVMKATLDGFRVDDLMTREVVTVDEEMTVADLTKKMLRERHMGYPVLRDDRVVGCVTLGDLEKVQGDGGDDARVRDIMSSELETASPEEDIYAALKRMTDRDIGRVPVLLDGRLVGILSRSDVMRGFQLRRLMR